MSTDHTSNLDRAEILRGIRMIEETIRPKTANSIELLIAALEAMGSGETIHEALERVRERAPEREIQDADELIRALYDIKDIKEAGIARKISRRIDELREGESEDAIYGLYAISEIIPHDASLSLSFAIECAQKRCGEHPCPSELFKEIYFDREGMHFGHAWQFWGARSREAIEAARVGFRDALLHAAGLGDEADYPESIAPPRAEPDGPIPPGCPPKLAEMIFQLDEAEDEEEIVEALREIADAEIGGAFAVLDEEIWENLPDDLKEFLDEEEIGVGARIGRLIEAVLGRSWIREHIGSLRDALLEWADGGAQLPQAPTAGLVP
jgi:hypothetical protein